MDGKFEENPIKRCFQFYYNIQVNKLEKLLTTNEPLAYLHQIKKSCKILSTKQGRTIFLYFSRGRNLFDW